eukprot:3882218-Pyramimonas_sp.AAC.1
MQVKFVRKTHYLFSVGKDKVVKYWDCDKFEPLLTLEGHKAEVWSLAISSYGDFIVTAFVMLQAPCILSRTTGCSFIFATSWFVCHSMRGMRSLLLSGSHDRSIRRWERTEDPFFIEEEQERRLESMFEEGIDNAGPQDE